MKPSEALSLFRKAQRIQLAALKKDHFVHLEPIRKVPDTYALAFGVYVFDPDHHLVLSHTIHGHYDLKTEAAKIDEITQFLGL